MSSLSELKLKTKSLNLLYVEDDSNSREQLKMILDMLFASVTIAKDGYEGFESYNSGKFDLVITDINMPRMDGIELMQKIKEINHMQKVIIVSAHDGGDYLLSAIRSGVDSFILKPVEIEQLESVLDKISTVIHNEKLQLIYKQELESEVENKTKELLNLAVTDELTGLFNRKKLNWMLQKSGEKVLMLLNIDNFDNINVTYGYSDGDIIMKEIASFLNEKKHDNSMLFRLGHDEFAYLYQNTTIDEVESYAKELQSLLQKNPIKYKDNLLRFTLTMVMAVGEKELLKDVHVAFKETRSIGKNRIGIYKPNSDLEANQHRIQKYIHIINYALSEKNIVPFYQPIINNKTLNIDKYECLARIKYEGKIINPSDFLETAELTGMLPMITRMMIQKSFHYFKNRKEDFSINISESDFNDEYLSDYLEENILRYGIDPNRVILEVLEGISAHGAKKSFDQIINLKSRGFKLSIDDFGAENSNFERVFNLSVDYIKIDGQFIKNMDSDLTSFNIVKTIAEFSKSIGAKVVAEFVHNQDIQKKVVDLGVEYSQGYYFSEPLEKIK